MIVSSSISEALTVRRPAALSAHRPAVSRSIVASRPEQAPGQFAKRPEHIYCRVRRVNGRNLAAAVIDRYLANTPGAYLAEEFCTVAVAV